MTGTLLDADYQATAEAAKDAAVAREAHPEKKDSEEFAVDSGALSPVGRKDEVVITETAAHDPRYPTEEERRTLRRVPGHIRVSAYLIGFIELCERFSYYGTTAVFTNFIQQPRPAGSSTGAGHGGQSGALGMGQQASTGLTTFNQFWVYCTPLLGGYLADTYFGRYKMIMIAVGIAQIGHILLTVSAIPSVIDKPHTSIGVFAIAIIIMGLGTGGFKSSISPLVAESAGITRMEIHTLKSGERVIHDPALTASRVFMYFYMMINIGALAGQIGMVYAEANVGFWLAFLLPTCIFFLAPIVLFIGRNRYNRVPPSGSALATAFRFLGFAAKGRWLKPKRLFAADFWESNKPSHLGSNKPAWMTFDDLWVDELRRGLKACQVFVLFPLWWLTYNQINNNLTSQAATMNTHGLPNDLVQNLDPIALVIFIPIFDLGVYPALRKMGINFTPIKKITAGFFCGSIAMISAAVTQHYIYQKSPCGNYASSCDTPADLNVWIQIPTYFFIAISEIFASITALEYAYTKAPKSMRTTVTAIFLLTSAIAAAIGEALVPLAADPHLVANYYVPCIISAVAGALFWFFFRKLDSEERDLNDLAEKRVEAEDRDAALADKRRVEA